MLREITSYYFYQFTAVRLYVDIVLVVIGLLENGHLEEALLKAERVEAEENQFNKQIE